MDWCISVLLLLPLLLAEGYSAINANKDLSVVSRNELEIAISELQKRNEELENEIRYINYQKSDCLVKCFWSEENRESAKKYLQTNRSDKVITVTGTNCQELFEQSDRELRDLKAKMDEMVTKIAASQTPLNRTEPAEELSRCQEDVVKLTQLYQASKKSEEFSSIISESSISNSAENTGNIEQVATSPVAHTEVSKNVLTTTKENPPTTIQQELSKCHLDNTRLYNAIVQLKKKSSAVSKGSISKSLSVNVDAFLSSFLQLKAEVESLHRQEMDLFDKFQQNLTMSKSYNIAGKSEEIENLKHQLEAQTQYIESTKLQSSRYKSKLTEVTSKLESCATQQQEFQVKLASLTSQQEEFELEKKELTDRYDSCQKERQLLTARHEQCTVNMKSADEFKIKHQTVSASLEAARKHQQDLQKQVATFKEAESLVTNKIEEINQQFRKFRSEQINQLIQKYKEAKMVVTSQTKNLKIKDEKIKKQRTTLQSLDAKLSSVMSGLRTVESTYKSEHQTKISECNSSLQHKSNQVESLATKNEKLRSVLMKIQTKSANVEKNLQNVHLALSKKTEDEKIRIDGLRVQLQKIKNRLKFDMECNEKLRTCMDQMEQHRTQLRNVQLEQYQCTTKIYQFTVVLKKVSKFLTYLLTRIFRVHDGINDLKQITVNLRQNLVSVHSAMGHCTGSLQALKDECGGLVSWYQSLPNIEGLKRRLTDCENEAKYGGGSTGYLIDQLKKQAEEFQRLTKQEHICEVRLKNSMTEMIELTRSVYLLSNNGENNDTISNNVQLQALNTIVQNHEKLKSINQVLFDHLANTTEFKDSRLMKSWNMSSFYTTEQALQMLFNQSPQESILNSQAYQIDQNNNNQERYIMFVQYAQRGLEKLRESKDVLIQKLEKCRNQQIYEEDDYILMTPERVMMENVTMEEDIEEEATTTIPTTESTTTTTTTTATEKPNPTTLMPSINIEKIKGLLNKTEVINPTEIKPITVRPKSDEIRLKMDEIREKLEKAKES